MIHDRDTAPSYHDLEEIATQYDPSKIFHAFDFMLGFIDVEHSLIDWYAYLPEREGFVRIFASTIAPPDATLLRGLEAPGAE